MPKAKKDNLAILSKNLFPVVGVGASAGGLEAFKQLIKAIPENSGMAYILVQHLHPEHESALPEILQRVTKIPVVEISDNVHVDPNFIYVIPSNKMLVASDGVLKLSPRPVKDRLRMPIDIFFSSLAEVHQAHSIGVILSGTGADGTAGLKDIKNHGGFTFAQEVASAAYDGMPQHAIDAEVVDFILPPEKIPKKIIALQQPFTITAKDELVQKNKTDEEIFRQILVLLRVRVGVDFAFYKQTTVRRRIIRRMVILNLEKITDYADYLKKNKPEQDILFQDLLIPVTSFFRDTTTFEALSDTIIPQIIKNKETHNPVRLWVAGCSTGQEAYSIAICLSEYLSDHVSNSKIQIFATDISEKSIEKARHGIYSKKEIEGISESRLNQFFNKTNGYYQAKKTIRDMCVFATHNFLKDPPFAKIDLISCRNVLIYLEPFLQKKALTTFHYALKNKGVLWLGKSETTGSSSDLFNPLGKKEKFYTRKSVPGRFMNMAGERNEKNLSEKNYFLQSKELKTDDFQKNADDILLSKYTPPGVIVNDQYDIVQFRSFTGNYLEPSPGKASLNVLKMAKEGLAFEIRNALHKAKTTSEPYIKEGIAINGGKKMITIEVIPLLNTIDLHFLILFRDEAAVSSEQLAVNTELLAANKKDEKNTRIKQLEKELSQAREDMRSIIEDQEAANEELQSANEELLSGSEELQSLNEELETSKEELQSTNEELITVNQELYDRNDQLNQSRKFAEATISVLDEPLLVLDKNFVIKSANKSFYKIFKLTEDDTLGHVLFELQNNAWNIPGLRKQLIQIQKQKEKMIEMEITFTFPEIGERIINFNIQPLQKENDEQLVLLALDDITEVRQAQKADAMLAAIIQSSDDAIISKTLEGIVTSWNHGSEKLFGYTAEEMIGESITKIVPKHLLSEEPMIIDKITRGETINQFETQRLNKNGKLVDISLTISPVIDSAGNITGASKIARDITKAKQVEIVLRESEERFRNLATFAPLFIWLTDAKLQTTYLNKMGLDYFNWNEPLTIENLSWKEFIYPEHLERTLQAMHEAIEKHEPYSVEMCLKNGITGKYRWFLDKGVPTYENNKFIGFIGTSLDIDDSKQAEKELKESEANFRQLAELMPEKITTTDADGNVIYYNKNWLDYTGLSFDELKDWGWEKIVHANDLEKNTKQWKEAIAAGRGLVVEERLLNKNNEYRWHLSRLSPVKDDAGKITKWISATTDIHDQKMREQTKDDFISIASHEMKTPLTTAKAYLQLLEITINPGNENAFLYARKAGDSVTRLNNLIGELLDVSKIQGGKLNYTISSFNFNEMIDDTVGDMQHSSPMHTIVKTGKVTDEVTGDKERLQQVVINLLSNAIKYSPDNREVFIDVEQNDKEIKVSVKDNGIGISKQNLEKIFDKYFRVQGHGINFQGLGIGLFISHEIIKRHHGGIWAESLPGKGSTFYFTIPVSQ